MIKRLNIFLMLFFNILTFSLTASATLVCSQVLSIKTFETLRSDFVQPSSPIARMQNMELEGALSRLEQGLTEKGDFLTIMSFGDPVTIAATKNWNQIKTEKALQEIASLLEKPENQKKILSEELVMKNFFEQSFTPWFDLIPKNLLSKLILAGLGGNTPAPTSERVILQQLPALIKTLGAYSPLVQSLMLRALKSPYYSLTLLPKVHLFSENIKSEFAKNWRVDQGRPELLIEELQLLSPENKSKLEANKELIACGTCPEMARGHFEPFFKDNAGKGTALIIYKGELIGLLKTTGDPSFLALRDVKNKKGELILLTGGIYIPPLMMQNKLEVSGPGMSPLPLQFLDISTSIEENGQHKPLSFYPKMFTKAPLESHQMQSSFQSWNEPTEGSIRQSFGFSPAPVEIVMGQEFKLSIKDLRSRAEEFLLNTR